jgi:hypothetical protein
MVIEAQKPYLLLFDPGEFRSCGYEFCSGVSCHPGFIFFAFFAAFRLGVRFELSHSPGLGHDRILGHEHELDLDGVT